MKRLAISFILLTLLSPLGLRAETDQCIEALKFEQETKVHTGLPYKIPQVIINKVSNDLNNIIIGNIKKHEDSPLTGREFNTILKLLVNYASKNGIRMTSKLDTVGVFPMGVFEVGLSGLGAVGKGADEVAFVSRHELAHLFHVVMVRAILIQTFHLRSAKGAAHVEAVGKFLEHFEGGMNYIEFEEMVTETAAVPHDLNSHWESKAYYKNKLLEVIQTVADGLPANKIDHRSESSFPGIYALFISRVPLVLGKSLGDLSVRLPLIMFTIEYMINPSFQEWVDQVVHSAF